MSRRKKTADQNPDQAARGAPARRRVPAPLAEVLLARRPATSPPPSALESEPARPQAPDASAETDGPGKGKRVARMVSAPKVLEGSELARADLLSRVLDSNGSGPITRAVNAYRKRGFEFPEEQPIQLKLLEHADEAEVCRALSVLAGLLPWVRRFSASSRKSCNSSAISRAASARRRPSPECPPSALMLSTRLCTSVAMLVRWVSWPSSQPSV